MKKKKKSNPPAARPAKPLELTIRQFAHLDEVKLTLGDLTVLVGPQGAGKSLALQWLKVAMDGRQIVDALRAAGHPTDRADVLIDLIFGTGMAPAWRDGESEVLLAGRKISARSLARIGDGEEHLFFVPAHRSMLISDGWASPFQKLTSDTPAVARIFSQNLFDRFSGKDAGTLFPLEKRLKREIREQIDAAVFHGGKIGIEEDAQHARRLRLVHGAMHLPFMTWTAGQREFTPLLLGLYHLLPSTNTRATEGAPAGRHQDFKVVMGSFGKGSLRRHRKGSASSRSERARRAVPARERRNTITSSCSELRSSSESAALDRPSTGSRMARSSPRRCRGSVAIVSDAACETERRAPSVNGAARPLGKVRARPSGRFV